MQDGKLIKDFVMGNDGDEPPLYKAVQGGTISTMQENYGEYGLVWIIRYDANGNEIDRYNMKYVSTITWQ